MNCEDVLPEIVKRCENCKNSKECQLSYIVKRLIEILTTTGSDTSPRSS